MALYRGRDLIAQMDRLDVPHGALAVWSLGQMGLAIKGAGPEVVYIDPCLSDVVQIKAPALRGKFARAFHPPVEPHEITNAAYVLCTHDHADHTDPLTLGPLAAASPGARFVITAWSHMILDEADIAPERRITPPRPGRRIVPPLDLPAMELGPLRVTAIPCAHYELERDDQGNHRWLGFLIEWNGVTLYHSGDTIVYPGLLDTLRALPRADVALVAANGRDARRDAEGIVGNLLPEEAAWLASELGWDVLLGGHNDLYAWNTLPAGALADACARICPAQRVHTLRPGELFFYVR
jgi:L-ascorbate metabolism protein UlaG (beta-lactamase superfamily)